MIFDFPNQVPHISNTSTLPHISVLPADLEKDFLFRTCPSDRLEGATLGKLTADEGYKRAAVIWTNWTHWFKLPQQIGRAHV